MSDAPPFAHLHCHTHYSLLDGVTRVPELVEQVKATGMNACAITDHGNLYGAIEFYNACRAGDVNPILGLEAYVAPGDRRLKTGASRMKEASFHLTLLAMNRTGFRNLVRLSSKAFLEGFYYKPRIDKEILEEHNEGIICLSGCASGELSNLILADRIDEARELCEWYVSVFGDRFYMEIQNSGIEIQRLCAEGTIDIAQKMGLPLVATNDAHYLCQTDADVQDVLLCVNTGATRNDEKRMKMTGNEFHVRTPEEMYAAFPEHAEAVARSQEIADRCDIDLDLTAQHFPVFRPPDNKTDVEYLREICEQKLVERYGDDLTQAHHDRLNYELSIIEQKGYSSYFLIVWDFVRFAAGKGIPSTARGSACGALVAFVLGMSDVCPLKYDLLFERFLDPNRNEPPDIDIDFCRDRRQLVIDYTKEKYGTDSVAQIGTFGTLKAKAAIRDVGRALAVPLSRVDEVAKMVPDTLGIKLKDALKDSPELNEAYQADEQVKTLLDFAMRLEGLARSAGTHAAGVVVADQPLSEVLPLQRITGKEDVITQWDGPTVEAVGLLKMDFLGLRNLSILDKAVQNVKKHRNIEIVPRELPLDDAETFALLQRGETKGIFQLESGGMRDLLTKMRPDKFADIIATSALYRPGPLEGGMVMTYVNVKNGLEPIPKVHPIIDEIVEETYGVMVYQEQVMRILNRLGGIELSSAYLCIKAISKKKLKIIAEFRQQFIDGAQKEGLPKDKAEELFGMIEKFAGYGFNKCVVPSTEVFDADNGTRTTVGELFHNRPEIRVHSLGDDRRLRPRRVSDIVWNGRKPVFELLTNQGRRLRATANHPVRTWNGWGHLADLKPGDRVAAPRRLKVRGGTSWPRHEIIALAGVLSEGNTCHPTCLYFYNNDRRMVDDFVEAAESFPESVARVDERPNGRLEVCVSTGRDTRFQTGQIPWNADSGGTACATPTRVRSGMYLWAEQLGILNTRAAEKRLPDECFALSDEDIELFLGRLWAGDGFVGSEGQMPYYATSSEELARGVQTLLLRLGIISGVRRKVFRYKRAGQDRPRTGYTVHLVGDDSIASFLQRVLPQALGREEQADAFRAYIGQQVAHRTSIDTIPFQVREWVDDERQNAGLTWREQESRSGVCVRELCRKTGGTKRGFRRATVLRLAEFFQSERLQTVAESDIFWDTVKSVTPCGTEDTYDLTVDGDHNFVADGLIVHNSHSTAYGAIAYQTAYLKAHYPLEFMAALLSCGMESSDRIAEHIDDCRRMNIEVAAPDVNSSDVEFSVVGDKLSFGMAAIKGVGEQAVTAIVAERAENGPFKHIFDLTERVDPKALNRSTLETLIRAGALDGFGPNRPQHMAAAERAVQAAASRFRDKQIGQKNLFGGDENEEEAEVDVVLPPAPDWTQSQKLQHEKEVFGFYLTSHPLSQHAERITRHASHSMPDLQELDDKAEVLLGGMIASIKRTQTKKPSRNGHTRYANFDFESPEGIVRCIIWPEQFARYEEQIKSENICYVAGRIDRRGREPNVIVDRIMSLEDADSEYTNQVAVKFQRGLHSEADMTRVRDILDRFPGKTEVVIVVDSAEEETPSSPKRYLLKTPAALRVACSSELQQALRDVLGEEHLRFLAPSRRRNGNGARKPQPASM